MRFDVELSELAEKQYDNILKYLAFKLKNPQAVSSVADDFDVAVSHLEETADLFEYCRSRKLADMGLRKLRLDNHRYLLVYRVEANKVIVEGIYHELQDYENAIR